MGSAAQDLRSFPEDARQRAGYQLYLTQQGLEPSDWKPITTVGPSCREIRVSAAAGAYRVIYLATIGDSVYVLHCFHKKSRQTSRADVELASQRYRLVTEMLRTKEK